MKLDSAAIDEVTQEASLNAWLRIIPKRHAATPLGAGPGASRFSSPTDAYRLIYAAQTLDTAIAETIIRDRFVRANPSQRLIEISEIADRAIAELSTVRPLRLVDLCGAGALRLGVPTDAIGARSHAAGQAFAKALFVQHPGIDGILYRSRLTSKPCMAVFDRATDALLAGRVFGLEQVKAVPDALQRLSVTLIV